MNPVLVVVILAVVCRYTECQGVGNSLPVRKRHGRKLLGRIYHRPFLNTNTDCQVFSRFYRAVPVGLGRWRRSATLYARRLALSWLNCPETKRVIHNFTYFGAKMPVLSLPLYLFWITWPGVCKVCPGFVSTIEVCSQSPAISWGESLKRPLYDLLCFSPIIAKKYGVCPL